jgi:hypothetical protein
MLLKEEHVIIFIHVNLFLGTWSRGVPNYIMCPNVFIIVGTS